MTRPFTRSQIILEGLAVPLAVVAVPAAFGVLAAWANDASGVTALSSAPPNEPAPQSRRFALQSTFAGETQ